MGSSSLIKSLQVVITVPTRFEHKEQDHKSGMEVLCLVYWSFHFLFFLYPVLLFTGKTHPIQDPLVISLEGRWMKNRSELVLWNVNLSSMVK
jgi:hypothetical protein